MNNILLSILKRIPVKSMMFFMVMLSCTIGQSQFDLALKIVPSNSDVVEVGDLVTYDIVVYNQGLIHAKGIKVVDYIPAGLAFSFADNPDWSFVGSKATTTIDGDLAPGESIAIQINLLVEAIASPTNTYNFAEILFAQDEDGNDATLLDIDSTPDSNPNNDEGADAFTITDDNIDDIGFQDEDDHDVALVLMCTETACNDQVNISLNASCDVVLTADMILESQDYPNGAYTVVAIDEDGNTVPNNLLNGTYLGQILEVSVSIAGCEGWGCWGDALIEDKIAIDLFCAIDTANCAGSHPDSLGLPVADNIDCDKINETTYLISGINGCSDIILSFEDENIPIDCQSGSPYIMKIERVWTAVDGVGNTSTCTSYVYIRKGNIADITSPPDYLHDPIECGSYPELPNGNPDPEFSGYPGGLDCPNLIVVYNDTRLDGACEGRFDVLREWTIVDWCNAEDTVFTQHVKVMDFESPVCNAPQIINSGTISSYCGGPVSLPHPEISDNCSSTSYFVKYKVKVPGESPLDNLIDLGVTGNDEDGYQIASLPVGSYDVVYFVNDACWNKSYCVSNLLVEDTSIPIAICNTEAHVYLDENGEAYLNAYGFDDGSIDNCGIVAYKSARMQEACGYGNTLFNDQVKFCCEDAGQEVMVIFRVYDAAGNFNDCMVMVSVFDHLVPTIECPADVTLTCSEYAEDPYLSIYPHATAYDNCDIEVDYFDVHAFNNCGVGIVVRTWSAIDQAGNEVTCKQYFEVESDYQYDEDDIDWPADTEIVACPQGVIDPDITGSPGLPMEACSDFDVSYTDEILPGGNGYCALIERTWTVVDECALNENNNTFTYVQLIETSENEVPVFFKCFDLVIPAGIDCEEYVDFTVEASDNCTPQSLISYTYTIDLFDDNSIDASGSGNNIKGLLPSGHHRVRIKAKDLCGNISYCDFDLHIMDEKAPTPVCLPTSVSLGQDGQVEIWANDFNKYSYDNCTPDSELTYSFSEDITDVVRIYDCDDIPNGAITTLEVMMYVWDSNGNYDFCTTSITITDTHDLCPNTGSATSGIQGKVMNAKDGQEFADVMVEIQSDNMSSIQDYTESDGLYSFDDLGLFQDYSLNAFKNDDALNGISTLDIVLIQKHILGLQPFVNQKKLVAADVNNSGSITGSDIVQLRKLILGLYPNDELPSNYSWRFYPADFEFNSNFPFVYEQEKTIYNLTESMDKVEFYGIKIGDVNQTASVDFDGNITEYRTEPVVFEYDDQYLHAGETVHIPLNIKEQRSVLGMQFALAYDETKVEVLNLRSLQMDIFAHHYQIFPGYFTFSWDSNEEQLVNTSDGLFLELHVKEDVWISDLNFEIDETRIRSEIFDSSLEPSRVDIENRNKNHQLPLLPPRATSLSQNSPNPFADRSKAEFYLQYPGKVHLTIMTLDGRVIKESIDNYLAGLHEIDIDGSWFPQVGLYYLKIETPNFTQAIKLIKI